MVVVLAVQLSLNQGPSTFALFMSKILRAGARPDGHANSANVLMHASGCSFLLAVFLCDVYCQETVFSHMFGVKHLRQSQRTTEKKGSKMVSARLTFRLMAKHGQFLLAGDFVPIIT